MPSAIMQQRPNRLPEYRNNNTEYDDEDTKRIIKIIEK